MSHLCWGGGRGVGGGDYLLRQQFCFQRHRQMIIFKMNHDVLFAAVWVSS